MFPRYVICGDGKWNPIILNLVTRAETLPSSRSEREPGSTAPPGRIFLGIPLALCSLVDGAKSMRFDGHSAVADKQHVAASLRHHRRKEVKNTTQTFSRHNSNTNSPCELGTGWDSG